MIDKVRAALAARGLGDRLREFDDSTRSAAEAAATVGCDVAQIAKTLVFRGASGRAVVVIASGINRVDEAKVAALAGERIRKADAAFVRAETGYAIGGVAPVALPRPPLIDRDLLGFAEVWAAAGTPRSVMRLTPEELLALSAGTAADVKLEA